MAHGDFFGEISPMFNVKRSATTMSRNFGTFGELSKKVTQELITQFPAVRVFLWENIMNTYDDDLKLFLFENLSNIYYL